MGTWKIKETDTSYRFLSFWKVYPTGSFCDYYSMVLVLAATLFVTGLCVALGIGLLIFGKYGLNYLYIDQGSALTIFLVLIAVIGQGIMACGILIFLGIGCLYAFFNIKDWLASKRGIDPDQFGNDPNTKNPSFIKTWYKAFKNKFCPLIEFVEE